MPIPFPLPPGRRRSAIVAGEDERPGYGDWEALPDGELAITTKTAVQGLQAELGTTAHLNACRESSKWREQTNNVLLCKAEKQRAPPDDEN